MTSNAALPDGRFNRCTQSESLPEESHIVSRSCGRARTARLSGATRRYYKQIRVGQDRAAPGTHNGAPTALAEAFGPGLLEPGITPLGCFPIEGVDLLRRDVAQDEWRIVRSETVPLANNAIRLPKLFQIHNLLQLAIADPHSRYG